MELEKKQRKFDQVCFEWTPYPDKCVSNNSQVCFVRISCIFILQMLADEKAASEKLSAERDAAEREARQNETKVKH